MLSALLISIVSVAAAQSSALAPHQQLARDVYKQLIEINTTDSVGDTTAAAEAMAARFRAAGFPAADIFVGGPDPRKGNLVVRYRGRVDAPQAASSCSRTSTSSRRRRKTGRPDLDPFTFIEKDGYFYGRGTADDKAMAAIFVANLLRMKQQGLVPERDIMLALTADEEGGDHNGVQWLLANHRALVDAEYGLNEGGGGQSQGRTQDREPRAGEREGLRRLHARGHEQGRPQLAAAAGQRDLPAGRGARADRQVRVSGEAERGDARVLRQDGGDRAGPAGGGLQGDRAADARTRRGDRAPVRGAALQRDAAHDLRRDDGRRRAMRRTRCRSARRRTSTAASCPARIPTTCSRR